MQVMDAIFKKNLWKFLKVLRVQANPIYCLLVASPIHYAWITIINKLDPTSQRRITIAQFVNSLAKMPSSGTYYKLGINLYYPDKQDSSASQTYETTYINDLVMNNIVVLYPSIIAYHCKASIEQGKRLELNTQTIKHYKFKARYIDELKTIIEHCNNQLTKNKNI